MTGYIQQLERALAQHADQCMALRLALAAHPMVPARALQRCHPAARCCVMAGIMHNPTVDRAITYAMRGTNEAASRADHSADPRAIHLHQISKALHALLFANTPDQLAAIRIMLTHIQPEGITMSTTPKSNIPVMITTKHRGVFAGLVPGDQDLTASTMALNSARMAIYWGTTRGLMELCETGPTAKSRISAPADIPVLHDITAVFHITPEAWAKWQAA
ncbi:DUF6948 domain-containing protein [Roseinatronobacter sp. NSM]|uniref:DUF6948 domain-containing protein n=1 Tax=Roseinatronobacter sp. NSM TaxID=3457785 RepID=UPI0040356E14